MKKYYCYYLYQGKKVMGTYIDANTCDDAINYAGFKAMCLVPNVVYDDIQAVECECND